MDIIAWHRVLFGHHFRCYYSVDNNVVAIDMEYDCPAVIDDVHYFGMGWMSLAII